LRGVQRISGAAKIISSGAHAPSRAAGNASLSACANFRREARRIAAGAAALPTPNQTN
jgi:hypothetical protein